MAGNPLDSRASDAPPPHELKRTTTADKEQFERGDPTQDGDTEEIPPVQRYELLQTLRQYGREQLLAVGEADALHDKHAAYFLALAEHTESARSRLDASGSMKSPSP